MPKHKRIEGAAARDVMAPADTRHGPRAGDRVRGPLVPGRETVESIVVAFTLALLFRAFEAEAFVIPTGSMAPTLMGRHKDLTCEACGIDYRVGCSAEADDPRKLIPAATCPNCGFVTKLLIPQARTPAYDPRFPSFSGDRILVDKFSYDFADPDRWDVVVFRYPEDAKTNYIKRLVGLPGETVSIAGGDIWIARDGGGPAIARKPPEKMLAMLQCVHDSRHVAPQLAAAGWPHAWSDWSPAGKEAACAWSTTDEGRSFTVDCPGPDDAASLRFRHFFPTPDDWRMAAAGESLAGRAVPRLIDDFQSYNTLPVPRHWVGDLAVALTVENRGPGGTLTLDLVEAGKPHRCVIDLVSGEARLLIAGMNPDDAPKARTRVRGRGRWTIVFANVDDELSLFVDGRKVEPDRPAIWRHPIAEAAVAQPYDGELEPGMNQAGDLAPVGLRAAGASLRVADLRVLRDVFYIGQALGPRSGQFLEQQRLDFPLEEGQFFVLGDNSPASKDSRLWDDGHHVDRRLLIGEALVVFWPHAVPAAWSIPVKIGGFELRLPCWPNFARMRAVR